MLLSVCSEYDIKHDIKYNSAKSKVMMFFGKMFKDIHILSVVLMVKHCHWLVSVNILGILSQIYVRMMTRPGNTRGSIFIRTNRKKD